MIFQGPVPNGVRQRFAPSIQLRRECRILAVTLERIVRNPSDEALESFQQGWRSTDGLDHQVFSEFFARAPDFADFRDYDSYFHRNVRCGILHQGETRHAWKILRSGPLFDEKTRTINATRFLRAMKKVLDDFCNRFKTADRTSKDPTW